jgi:hypothetical protein
MLNIDCGIVDVRTWKGSLGTPQLRDIVKHATGKVTENEHVACAVGIGLHHFGIL